MLQHRTINWSFAALLLCLLVLAGANTPVVAAGLALNPSDRVMVVAPHPDDETLGAGGVLQAAQEAHIPVSVVVVTNGDGSTPAAERLSGAPTVTTSDRIKLGNARQGETLAALASLGVAREAVQFLGYPDKSLSQLWTDNWRTAYYSPALGSASNVYRNVRSPRALFTGVSVRDDLTALIREFRPTIVLVPSAFDMHPDHRAAALFAQQAIFDIPGLRPRVYAYVVHRGPWPSAGEYLQVPESLPTWRLEWLSFPLKPEWVAKKAAAIKLYKTQIAVSPTYLLSFAKANELFEEVKEARLHGSETVVSSESEARAAFRNVAVDHEQVLKVKNAGVWQLSARLSEGNLHVRLSATVPEIVPTEYTFLVRDSDRFMRITTDQPSATIPVKGEWFFVGAQISDAQGHAMALPWTACERVAPPVEIPAVPVPQVPVVPNGSDSVTITPQVSR